MIDAVVRQRLTSIEDLRVELERLGTRGRRGLGRLAQALDRRSPDDRVPESRFNRLVGELLVRAGLPQPRYEWTVRSSNGRFAGRVDLAYPGARVAIECDSERWHRNRHSFIADPRRKNRLLLAGFQVLTFTWDDYINQPDTIIKTTAAALALHSDEVGTVSHTGRG